MHNKTDTKNLILHSCGINIFKNEEYKTLSQQKCIEKIFNEKSPQVVANLLDTLCKYFSFKMGANNWSPEEEMDYKNVQSIICNLKSGQYVELPETEKADMEVILKDIYMKFQIDEPEMALDRLHTFSLSYLQDLCEKRGISIYKNKNEKLPLHSLVGSLKKWYCDNNYFESEFSIVAIQNTINIFDKFNSLRNNHSAAHPNDILNKLEAEYAVRIISDTITFIDKIEKEKEESSILNEVF